MDYWLPRLRPAFAGAIAFLALSASGTSMVSLSLEQLGSDADSIVQARVKSVGPSQWAGDGPNKIIITRVELAVRDTLKGDPAESITLMQKGGAVGEIGQRVDGEAAFNPGEEVIVFLNKKMGGIYQLHGMSQGKFTVEKSSDGKMAFVVPSSLAGVELLDTGTGAGISQASSAPLELGEFRNKVRAALGAKSKR